MSSGKIKKLNRDRGFGFISGNGTDYFFHRSEVKETSFESLNEDQMVDFDVQDSPKGPRAVNVRPSAA